MQPIVNVKPLTASTGYPRESNVIMVNSLETMAASIDVVGLVTPLRRKASPEFPASALLTKAL